MSSVQSGKLPKQVRRREPGKTYVYTLVRHYWEGTRMRRRTVPYTTTRNLQHAQALMEAYQAIARDRGEEAYQVSYHIYMSEGEDTEQEQQAG